MRLRTAGDAGAELFVGRVEHMMSGATERFDSAEGLIMFMTRVLAPAAASTPGRSRGSGTKLTRGGTMKRMAMAGGQAALAFASAVPASDHVKFDDPVHRCADSEAVAGDELDGRGRVARERSTDTGGKAGEALAGVVLPLSACLAFARGPADETDLEGRATFRPQFLSPRGALVGARGTK